MEGLQHLVINFEVEWEYRKTNDVTFDRFMKMTQGQTKLKTFKLRLLTPDTIDKLDKLCEQLFKLLYFEQFEVTLRLESLEYRDRTTLLNCLKMKNPIQITVEWLDGVLQRNVASQVEYF